MRSHRRVVLEVCANNPAVSICFLPHGKSRKPSSAGMKRFVDVRVIEDVNQMHLQRAKEKTERHETRISAFCAPDTMNS